MKNLNQARILTALILIVWGLGAKTGMAQSLTEILARGERSEVGGDWNAAERAFAEAAREHPSSPLPRYHLARLRAIAGATLDAIMEARAALVLDPEHLPARILLGRLYREPGW